MQIKTPQIYRAAVIGAGPSGVACVGNLLDRFSSSSSSSSTTKDRILWIDPEFKAGRLNSYPAVPSNTKVCLFTKFALECDSFKAKSKSCPTLETLCSKFDPQSGCELKWAAELCKQLTRNLQEEERVHSIKGKVIELKGTGTNKNKTWTIKTEDGETFESDFVFLTTGSRPKHLTAQEIPFIHLDDALNPFVLDTKINSSDIVAVYGSSHSAMLVLKNLISIPNSPKKIINFYRQAAKFAEFPDPINRPDRILHDNTGLKGETADWVRSWHDLPPEEFEKFFQGKLERIKVDTNTKSTNVNVNVTVNIYAVGYERNPLPKIKFSEKSPEIAVIDYTTSGQLITKTPDNSVVLLDGLYGFGIAFPERVKDLDGSDELAVGMWKFMRHIKKCINSIDI